MIDTVDPRHTTQITRVYAIENGDVDAVFVRVRPALVVGIDAAGFAKLVFGGVGVELIKRQIFSALQDFDAI